MKYVCKRKDAKKLDEHNISKFTEYSLPFNALSMGLSEINGPYPEIGFDVDEEIEAVWYVLSGSGDIYIGNKLHLISTGDMVFIPKGEKYRINGRSLRLVVASSPVWFPEQHKHLE